MSMKEQKTFKVSINIDRTFNCKDEEEAVEMFIADLEGSNRSFADTLEDCIEVKEIKD